VFAFSVCKGEFYGNLWRNILSLFFQENADVSIFVEIQGQLSRKNALLPPFFFVDSNSPCKDLLFPRGPYPAKKPWYLVECVEKYSKKNKIGFRHFNALKSSFKVPAWATPNEVDRESVQKESGFLNGSWRQVRNRQIVLVQVTVVSVVVTSFRRQKTNKPKLVKQCGRQASK